MIAAALETVAESETGAVSLIEAEYLTAAASLIEAEQVSETVPLIAVESEAVIVLSAEETVVEVSAGAVIVL